MVQIAADNESNNAKEKNELGESTSESRKPRSQS